MGKLGKALAGLFYSRDALKEQLRPYEDAIENYFERRIEEMSERELIKTAQFIISVRKTQ